MNARLLSPHHRLFLGKDAHKFSAAHMTVFSDGSKERIHGHNFQVEVTIDLKEIGFEKFLDINLFKDSVKSLCEDWDERLLVAEQSPYFKLIRRDSNELEFSLCGKRYVIPADEIVLLQLDNITVEALSSEFAQKLMKQIKSKVKSGVILGVTVEVSETRGQGGSCYMNFE